MDKLNLGQHISTQFNDQLEEVRSKVLQMGGIVEEQVGNAVRALVDGDAELAGSIVMLATLASAFSYTIILLLFKSSGLL